MKHGVPGAYNRSGGRVVRILEAEELALLVPAADANGKKGGERGANPVRFDIVGLRHVKQKLKPGICCLITGGAALGGVYLFEDRKVNSEQLLIDDDFAAAEEALNALQPDIAPELRAEQLRRLAERHAKRGDSQFRLECGLRPARNQYERICIRLYVGRSSIDECRALYAAYDEQPVDDESLASLLYLQEERVSFYSKFLGAIHSAVYDRKSNWVKEEIRALRYIRETQHKQNLTARKLEQISAFVMECRLEKGLRPVSHQERTASTAVLFGWEIFRQAREHWESCLEIAERSRRPNSGYASATTASALFEQGMQKSLPNPGFLQTALYEEFALARMCLRKQTQASPFLRIDNHVHVAPPNVNVAPNINVHMGSREAATPQKGKTAKRQSTGSPDVIRKRTVKLSKWAVALGDSNEWHLFHQYQGRWDWRRMVDVPKGHPHTLLAALADEGGSLSRNQAIKLFKHSREGQLDAALARVPTDALAKAKKAIRVAIADAAKCDLEQVLNPIPNNLPGWLARIEIGYATKDDNDRLVFKRKQDL